MNKFAPLHPKVSTLLHGADYNPEQWENDPDIIDKDIAMMQQAKCNVMSVGIFSWAKLEPREGVFNFARLDIILDKLYAAGIHVFLATPSGRVRRGCRSAIRRFCGWGAIGCRPCTAAVTTTVCRHRSIARKPGKSIPCWQNVIPHTRRCWAGIFPTNMAVNAIAISARTVFATG